MGYRSVPWLGATYFFLFVQLILSMLTQIHRKDQISITVCAIGLYMLSYPENTRRHQFRMLVALIFLSIVQDVFWFVLNRDVEDDEDDGGLERGVKSFSRAMSFVSFVWRVSLVNICLNDLVFVWDFANLCVFILLQFVLAMILWKDSLDFIAIVKAKNVNREE